MSDQSGKNSFEQQELSENQASEAMQSEADQDSKLGLSMLGKVALGVVVSVSLIISISCLMKFNQLNEEKKVLKEELEQYNEVMGELQHIFNSAMDDEQIIEEARDKLGLAFPDEDIYYQD